MKEIKFRVWDKTFKMMLSPELVDIDFNEGKIEVIDNKKSNKFEYVISWIGAN